MRKIDWNEVISEGLAAIGFIGSCITLLFLDSILAYYGL